MKMSKCVLCVVLWMLCVSVFAQAAAIYVYDGGLGTWSDVNKTNVYGDPDGWLCWAASASNALAWAGWPGLQADGITPISSASDIFSYFTANWPNARGNVMYAYDWWFDGVDADPDTNPDGTGTAGFYADDHLIPGVYGGYWGGMHPTEAEIVGYINDDRAIEFSISSTGFGHSMTIWGIDTALDLLYFTDSDDGGAPALRSLNYYSNSGYLWLDNYTNLYITTPTDYEITQLIRLNRNDAGLTPSLPGGVIPEPSTGILLSIGLIALGYFGKKRR